MNQDRLVDLLRRDRPDAAECGPDCPGEGELAEYLGAALDPATVARFESHIGACYPCRFRIAATLRADVVTDENKSPPELLMARARRLASADAPKRLRRAPLWAAAATVLLTLGLFVVERTPAPDSSVDALAPTTRESRFADHGPALPKIALPAENAGVSARDLAVHWSAVPGSRYYELRIVTDAGDLVWQERVTRTDWTPTAQLALKPGAEYFVRVDAYLDDAKPISSEHVMFKVAPQR